MNTSVRILYLVIGFLYALMFFSFYILVVAQETEPEIRPEMGIYDYYLKISELRGGISSDAQKDAIFKVYVIERLEALAPTQ